MRGLWPRIHLSPRARELPMTYILRAGLSFCAIDSRLLFLDLPRDRYFCLSPAAEAAFCRLWRGDAPEEADRERLRHLARTGLLIEDDRATAIAPCAPPTMAATSLLDTSPHTAGAAGRALALLAFSLARLELRTTSIERALARFAGRKLSSGADAEPGRVAGIAAAFEANKAIVGTHDLCLPRSLGIAHRLLSVGARPDLVLGVKLGPFLAHAWVQCGDSLVNERLEVARMFTPILVL